MASSPSPSGPYGFSAERILIIRRGPTRVFHLVLWDTEHDTFDHGSWFRWAPYVRRCDVSFHGQWLVYFAMGPTRQLYSWVALSRPRDLPAQGHLGGDPRGVAQPSRHMQT